MNDVNEKVRDILKRKRGTIKSVPRPPGPPAWEEILDLTWGEILRRDKLGLIGYSTLKKVLNEARFNK